MAKSQFATVFRHLRRIIGLPGGEELPDGQLLDSFVHHHDEAAFERLVGRYGSMVLGVCRRLLNDPNDADDAFQATFLVLVRRAAALNKSAPLGSWLYGVAYRVAIKARASAARRRERERQTTDMSSHDPTADASWREVRAVLDEELQHLPEKYRAPLVLCYLVGKTNEEAARELGCPAGSMWWRLDRARELLRTRLMRRGVTLTAAALTALLAEQTQAAVSAGLLAATLHSAALFATGQAALTTAQAQAFTLAEGVTRTMFLNKFMRTAAAILLLLVLAGAGVGAAAFGLLGDQDDAAKNALPPVIRSAQSGAWSAAATWEGGKVPGAGARVMVRDGHRVVYDVKSDQVIRSLNIAGILTFAADKDTRLDAGLIKIQPGDEYSEEGFDCEAHVNAPAPGKPRPALEVGTPEKPIDARYTSLIRLHYIEGMSRESCPALVCCTGRLDLHGAPLSRTWVKLGETAKAGETTLTLAEAVTGWKVGDRVILTATQRNYKLGNFTEERLVAAIEGTKLTLDKALENDHLGTGEYRGEVANLSRNVVVESADPEGVRAHTMYHKYSAGALSYTEFRHLGKRDVLGRYSLHYHLVGDTMRGSYVIGNSIWNSHNRWLTIHGTNYLVVRDNVGYKSVGHGFFLEDGTEVYNVLDRNLAVAARRGKRLPRQVLPFDANDGAGYWWANSLNTFTRNVAADCDQYGFRYEATQTSALKLVFNVQQPDGTKQAVDIRTLPFVRFDDNEVHSNVGLYGLNLGEGVNRVGPDTRHPFVVRNMKIWDTHYGFRPQVPSLLVENMKIHRVAYGVYHPNYDNHVYRDMLISQTNTEPFNRGHDDVSAQYGVLAVDGLTFDGCRSGGMPLIQISDDNPNGQGLSHFRNVKLVNWNDNSKAKALVNLGGGPRPQPKTEKGVPIYVHDWFGPGQHAVVVSTRSGEFKAEPSKYRSVPQLTGDESRAAEARDVEFPKLLDPVDDLPPTTVITHVTRANGKVTVRGTAGDNGEMKRVLVNGKEAKALTPNFAEWEIVLDNVSAGELKLEALSEDAAGNVEKRPHVLVVK
jgi:RNA polymerase sigma factor (sigma-70 family)